MKTNKSNLNLEQLLADVEHAGRDARRRDKLAAMIDEMAGADKHKQSHGFWWYGVRVAAAACIIFFISTAVRIWFIPTAPQEPLLAENRLESEENKVKIVDSTIATPVKPATMHHVASHRSSVVPVVELTAEEVIEPVEEVMPSMIEELIADKIENQEAVPIEEIKESALETIAAPIVSIGYSESQEQPKERTRRRSILSELFRQPEPDDMTGTMLALKLL